jgi:hypothetical protein
MKSLSLVAQFKTPILPFLKDDYIQSLFSGPQTYFTNVSQAFQTHFRFDTEMEQVWNTLSYTDILQAVLKMTKHRYKRELLDTRDLPEPVLCSNELKVEKILPWSVFAQAAYKDSMLLRQILSEQGHELIQHEHSCALMEPSYFLSMSKTKNQLVIAIKGTDTVKDLLTNLFIAKEELKVEQAPEEADLGIHAGILHSARFVLDRISPLVQRLFVPAQFEIVVVGHSLGAGVATALTIMLKEEMKIPHVHCYAFAPPPCVSLYLAQRSQLYVTSIVNNDDAIPRTGVSQLKSVLWGIRQLVDVKEAHGNSWNQVELVLDAMTWKEILEQFGQGYVERKFDTYLAGRILFLYKWGKRKGTMEISCQDPTLRMLIISCNMITDHQLHLHAIGGDVIKPALLMDGDG